ncbi:hypothetical protein niasHS_004535 [Heterodera schachtii]|uniref:Uncharacterized protein n=1 Tax=Heterodera schachtii TaxID=97005 RepID=A0ABD2JMH7_HETSC
MSSSFDVFKMTDDDAMKFLMSDVWKRRSDVIHVINQHSQNVGETVVRRSCRAIAAIENPSDVMVVVSAQRFGCEHFQAATTTTPSALLMMTNSINNNNSSSSGDTTKNGNSNCGGEEQQQQQHVNE